MIIKWCCWFLLTDFKLMFLSFCQGLVQCLCMLKYFQVFKIIAIFQIWIFKMFLFLWCFIFTYKALKQFSLSWTKVAYHWWNACAIDQCLKYYTIFIILVNTYYIIYDLYSFTYSLQFEIIYLKNLFACQNAANENMSPIFTCNFDCVPNRNSLFTRTKNYKLELCGLNVFYKVWQCLRAVLL